MRVHEEVLQAGVFQQLIEALHVTALGQPDAFGPFAEVPLEFPTADLNLSAASVFVDYHQRHETMRGGAGHDFELAGLKEAPKAVEEVVAVLIDEHLAGAREAVVIHLGQRMKLRRPAGAFQFLVGEGDEVVEMADVAILQQRIGEHGGQRRRDGHGETPVHAVAFKTVEHLQQGDVRFGNGFVEPILFEEILVFGMANERQMGVQDQGKVAELASRIFLQRCSLSEVAYKACDRSLGGDFKAYGERGRKPPDG